jgi:hypothetical protein
MTAKRAAEATGTLLRLPEAAEHLVSRWRIFVSRSATGAPPISARAPDGSPLFAVKDLDAWAAALPRRGARGDVVTEGAARSTVTLASAERPDVRVFGRRTRGS